MALLLSLRMPYALACRVWHTEWTTITRSLERLNKSRRGNEAEAS
jgi:hypothetical protein